MRRTDTLATILVSVCLAPLAGCERTLVTGKVGNTRNAPSADGTCPTGLALCGKGAFAQCLDLQNDRHHCGDCGNACVAGIACVKGRCEQVACSGPVSVTSQPIAGLAPTDLLCAHRGLLADVNGDGHPDLISYGCGSRTFEIALGALGGGFGPASIYEVMNASSMTIVAADSNGDGCDDLYVSDASGSPCLERWLGHPDGRLTRSPNADDAKCQGPDRTVADLNGDGIPDMVSLSPPPEAAYMAVFLADANGAFHQAAKLPVRHNGVAFVVRDWNGDGFPDLVNTAFGLSVYLNRGDGSFEDEVSCGVLTSPSQTVVVRDFNHDGHWDVAATMIDTEIGVLLGAGGCQFGPMAEYPLSGSVVALADGDLDGDGIRDLVARTSDGGVYFLRGDVAGSFMPALLASVGRCGTGCSLFLGDVTGDHRADVVLSDASSTSVIAGVATQSTSPAQILGNDCP